MTAFAPQSTEPQAPAVCHIDVGALVHDITPGDTAVDRAPALTALDLQLLEAARICATNGAQPPRRELVAAALREVERQTWWRDRAESQVVALRQELEAERQAEPSFVRTGAVGDTADRIRAEVANG